MADTRATALVTLPTAKHWLGVTDDSHDPQIIRLVNAVTALIERKTHRVYVTRTLTELYDGPGGARLRLRHFPVVSVTTLTITRTEDGTPETIASTDYDVDQPNGIIRLRATVQGFDQLFQNVSVTYSAGYGAKESSGIPADAESLALDMAKVVWLRYRSDVGMATSVTMDAGTMVMSEEWPRHIRDGLRALRRPVVG